MFASFANSNVTNGAGEAKLNRDHLGNIREVISETGAIEQVTHYYPFGTPFSDGSGTGPDVQPYKYNGKEFDAMHGLNTYDYGARQYDPLLAVWHGVDPLCEKDYGTGTSVYCRNNPVKYIDPDGNNPIYDEDGNFLGTDDNGLQGHYYVMNNCSFIQGMSHAKVGDVAVMGKISRDVENRIDNHYNKLPNRPDYDGFVTVEEGINWAKSHPNALRYPTPDNMLYIDSSQLDFGSLTTSDFPKVGIPTHQNLFVNGNIIESIVNPELMATVYALGRVDMILTNRTNRTVKIVNNNAADYDWNTGGGIKRNAFIQLNNTVFGIDPKAHGFKTFYYGIGTLRK